MKIPISVIVMTKNEERNIAKCLHSIIGFEEIFVVDSGSTDRTCTIAKEMGSKVVNFQWNGKYPKKKQWCLESLPFMHNWVLYVDADEEVTPRLAEELRILMETGPRYTGYFVGYDYIFLGQVLKHGHRVYKLVLFDRLKGRFFDYDDLDAVNMWEVEGHYQPKIEGKIGTLRNRMLHNDYASLYHYFERHNRYSDWEAILQAKGSSARSEESQPAMRHALKKVFAAMPCKGLIAFTHSFILKLGFLDGHSGFHFALARAFYYWQLSIKLQEIKAKQ